MTAALLGGLIAAAAVVPGSAWAVEPQPPNDVGQLPDIPTLPTCSTASWAQTTVKIHVAEFDGTPSEQTLMDDAIRDVNAQINDIGASAIRITTITTTEAFHVTPYHDTTPVIHVGFQPIAEPTIAAYTWPTFSCERHIVVDTDSMPWVYYTPGGAYYKVGSRDGNNNVYFRGKYLHELLHALKLGLDDDTDNDLHPDDVYSFLNYGETPWAHARVDAMMRPLPYDVRELRQMFPASGPHTEVAVLNTWMTDTQPGVVTRQAMLCAPSAGNVSVESRAFADYCATGDVTAVCPGSTIQVHYTLANYSTSSVNVTSNVWLSSDPEWDPQDHLSPTSKTYSVPAATAHHKFWGYAVPSLPLAFEDRTFYVIVRVTATTPSGVTVRDSIPMRGTMSVPQECITATQAQQPPTGDVRLQP